jgi:hypothetical protein
MTARKPKRDGGHPAKRRQMEQAEEYGQVSSKVSPRGPSHPGVKERPAGARSSGSVKGGERAKPGQMTGDEDKSAKDD